MSSVTSRFQALALGKGFLRMWLATLLFWNPLLIVVLFFVTGPHRSAKWFLALGYLQATVVCSVCVIVSRAAFFVISAIQHRRRREANPTTSWRVAAAFALFALPFGHWLALHTGVWAGRALGLHMSAASWRGSGPYLLLGCGVCGAFFLWRDRTSAREELQATRLQLQSSENARLQTKLAALTAQLNPHLLFNALNTVASLIESDPRRAEHTVVRLSALYRGVLAATQRTRHSLADELALCQAYVDVEHARFGDRVAVEVEIAPGLRPEELAVPALLLQPLVENAVKHGISGRAAGGHILLTAGREGDALRLAVQDDGVGFGNSPRAGTGTGIDNCRKRLELAYAQRASLEIGAAEGGGTRVVITLPASTASEIAA